MRSGQLDDGVAKRPTEPGRANGTQRGAVLDDPPLAAVVPHEMWDAVNVRRGTGRNGAQADRRDGREDTDSASVETVLRQESKDR